MKRKFLAILLVGLMFCPVIGFANDSSSSTADEAPSDASSAASEADAPEGPEASGSELDTLAAAEIAAAASLESPVPTAKVSLNTEVNNPFVSDETIWFRIRKCTDSLKEGETLDDLKTYDHIEDYAWNELVLEPNASYDVMAYCHNSGAASAEHLNIEFLLPSSMNGHRWHEATANMSSRGLTGERQSRTLQLWSAEDLQIKVVPTTGAICDYDGDYLDELYISKVVIDEQLIVHANLDDLSPGRDAARAVFFRIETTPLDAVVPVPNTGTAGKLIPVASYPSLEEIPPRSYRLVAALLVLALAFIVGLCFGLLILDRQRYRHNRRQCWYLS